MPSITSARAADLSIGEVSRISGTHIETIRYYERIKMIASPPRDKAGRRVYGRAQLRTLAFIRRARELGFTLKEIRALIALNDSEATPCAEAWHIANDHLSSVRAKLSDLARLESVLAETVARCLGNQSSACPVLDMLETGTSRSDGPTA